MTSFTLFFFFCCHSWRKSHLRFSHCFSVFHRPHLSSLSPYVVVVDVKIIRQQQLRWREKKSNENSLLSVHRFIITPANATTKVSRASASVLEKKSQTFFLCCVETHARIAWQSEHTQQPKKKETDREINTRTEMKIE